MEFTSWGFVRLSIFASSLNDHDLGCWTISMKYEPVYPIEYIIPFNEKLAGMDKLII